MTEQPQLDTIGRTYDVGDSWSGGGDHEGHVVTATTSWPMRADDDRLTSGRVQCSCGAEWDTMIPFTDLNWATR